MIEINLIPDIKRELLKAQRMRSVVISISVLAGIIAVGVVVMLGLIVFVAQTVASGIIDKNITEEHNTLKNRSDTVQVLTIQQQLHEIAGLEDNKQLVSRIIGAVYDISKSVSGPPVQISKLGFDRENNVVTVEGQAVQGIEALDAFKKAAERTTFTYANANGESVKGEKLLSGELAVTEASYGENADGQRVQRFTVTFSLNPNVLKFDSFNSKIYKPQAPGRQNVTDSYLQIPNDMFSEKAKDEEVKP
ncbi:MAG: hypothetical protein LBL84_00450 [Candidatus Nomurabacteria bacterium]|jgi:hypothetical protein|nr:hypothetical protein [Candidatus Nomurabacteria bacterium]